MICQVCKVENCDCGCNLCVIFKEGQKILSRNKSIPKLNFWNRIKLKFTSMYPSYKTDLRMSRSWLTKKDRFNGKD